MNPNMTIQNPFSMLIFMVAAGFSASSRAEASGTAYRCEVTVTDANGTDQVSLKDVLIDASKTVPAIDPDTGLYYPRPIAPFFQRPIPGGSESVVFRFWRDFTTAKTPNEMKENGYQFTLSIGEFRDSEFVHPPASASVILAPLPLRISLFVQGTGPRIGQFAQIHCRRMKH